MMDVESLEFMLVAVAQLGLRRAMNRVPGAA